MIYDKLMEKLLAYFTGPLYRDEVAEAKREFFEEAGLVDDENWNFEVRMAQFLDWFIFTRELTKSHLPPVQFTLENKPFPMDEGEDVLIENMTKARHSLFEFLKESRGDVHVKDLFDGKKYVLRNSTVTTGFNHDEIFEARLIPFEDTQVFSKGFCFHPAEAKSFILGEIKKIKHLEDAPREALMLRLLKMRYRFEQYKHIRLEFIYTNDTKLRV